MLSIYLTHNRCWLIAIDHWLKKATTASNRSKRPVYSFIFHAIAAFSRSMYRKWRHSSKPYASKFDGLQFQPQNVHYYSPVMLHMFIFWFFRPITHTWILLINEAIQLKIIRWWQFPTYHPYWKTYKMPRHLLSDVNSFECVWYETLWDLLRSCTMRHRSKLIEYG